MLLPGDEERVDDAAAVVDSHVAQQLDAPGLGVDLDNRDVGAEGVGRFALVEVELGPQALLEVGRASSRVAGCHGQLRPRQCRGGGAGDADALALVHGDVGHIRFEQVRRQALGFVDDELARLVDCAAADLERARSHRAHPARDERGVGLHDRDCVHRHAEQLGHDHLERGLETLTVR